MEIESGATSIKNQRNRVKAAIRVRPMIPK